MSTKLNVVKHNESNYLNRLPDKVNKNMKQNLKRKKPTLSSIGTYLQIYILNVIKFFFNL